MRGNIQHIGIIPDGGRRWARANSVSLVEAYKRSMHRLLAWADIAFVTGCTEVSIYLLSAENLGRSPAELQAVFDVLPALCATLDELARTHGAGVTVIGDTSRLPAQERLAYESLNRPPIERTLVNLLVGYDAWDEIRFALATDRDVSRLGIGALQVRTPVDAVLRTGGGNLLSGFLPLQSRYATLVVTPTLFNDVDDGEVKQLFEAAMCPKRLLGL